MKKITALLISSIILIVTISNTCLASQYIVGPGFNKVPENVRMDNVSLAMMQASYWDEFPGSEKVLMNPAEIEAKNAANFANPDCCMNKLSELPATFDGNKIKASLAGFSNPTGLYVNGKPVPVSYYEGLRANINGARVSAEMPLLYGFCTNRSELKSIPSAVWLSDDKTDPEWDNVVLSAVLIGEPLAVYFSTADGAFTYVKSEICDGWIPTQDIVLCHNKQEWEAAQNPENFIVVTGPEIITEISYDAAHSEVIFEMGTRLELCEEPVQYVDNRMSWCNYVAYYPGRGADGFFEKQKILIPFASDVSVGYMRYTQKNVIDLAFKSIGKRYGWGGSMSAQDCSSFAREVYLCFGFCLPRNTTWQRQMKADITDLSKMNSGEKSRALDGAAQGSIVQFPGHEMIYVGEKNGKHYVVNDVSSLAEDTADGLTKRRVRTVIINSLEDTKRANGKTWFDELNSIITIK